MRLKPGVRARGVQPETVLAIVIAAKIYEAAGAEFVVTSITDGRHGVNSLHSCGLAFDCRTRHLSDDQKGQIHVQLKAALPGYDVVLESDHFHIEYDPK